MKLTDLRGILQYIPQFREKTFILAIDGAIVTDENFATLLLDVAVLRSLNIRVVLVHGASAQIRDMAEAQKVTPSNLDGSGVTDDATFKLALTAANRLTHEILEGLSTSDLRGASTNVVIAHPMGIIQGVDHQFTGKVERVDTELLQTLLAQGVVPVIPAAGIRRRRPDLSPEFRRRGGGGGGGVKGGQADFYHCPGRIRSRGGVIRQIPVADLESFWRCKRTTSRPNKFPRRSTPSAACKAGVPRVHVINGKVDEGLLAEVFSNEGIGTLIYANDYQQIRRAIKKDIRAIQSLTRKAVESDELVKRTRAVIEKSLGDYFIFEIDKNPVACVALHVYPDQKKGELACLYVSSLHENRGIGRKVDRVCRNQGARNGIERTHHAFDAGIHIFPVERRIRRGHAG